MLPGLVLQTTQLLEGVYRAKKNKKLSLCFFSRAMDHSVPPKSRGAGGFGSFEDGVLMVGRSRPKTEKSA